MKIEIVEFSDATYGARIKSWFETDKYIDRHGYSGYLTPHYVNKICKFSTQEQAEKIAMKYLTKHKETIDVKRVVKVIKG
jgi:hypothetical protein